MVVVDCQEYELVKHSVFELVLGKYVCGKACNMYVFG